MTSGISSRLGAALVVALTVWLGSHAQVGADPPLPTQGDRVPNALCLACHEQKLTIEDGAAEARVVNGVSDRLFANSAHKGTGCVQCHPTESAIPHVEDRAMPGAGATVSCATCHADADQGYRDGPHGTLAELGDRRGPACADCHGDAHYVQAVQEWSETDRVGVCAKCHSGAGPSFLEASPGHRSPSAGFLSTPYFAGLFLMILTAGTLAFGIVHVELQMLRWLVRRWRGDHSSGGAGDGHPR